MPPCDVARSDAEVARLLTASSLFAIARSAAAKAGYAWNDSRTSRWLGPFGRALAPASTTDCVRVAGFVALVSAVTVLALQMTAPPGTRWFESLLPAMVAVAGVLVVAAAGPIARGLADTRQ